MLWFIFPCPKRPRTCVRCASSLLSFLFSPELAWTSSRTEAAGKRPAAQCSRMWQSVSASSSRAGRPTSAASCCPRSGWVASAVSCCSRAEVAGERGCQAAAHAWDGERGLRLLRLFTSEWWWPTSCCLRLPTRGVATCQRGLMLLSLSSVGGTAGERRAGRGAVASCCSGASRWRARPAREETRAVTPT
jgi:hypothetical protein